MNAETLRYATVEQLERFARYLGVPLPKRRNSEGEYRRRLAHAILRFLKRGGQRTIRLHDPSPTK